MKYKAHQTGFLVRLEKGEEFIESVKSFASEAHVAGAFFYGLGGAQSARLSMYRYDTDNEYHPHDFAGPLEITNVTGNIAIVEGQIAIHAHATIAGLDMNASGGHVEEMIISATCELFVTNLEQPLTRSMNEKVGLNLLDL